MTTDMFTPDDIFDDTFSRAMFHHVDAIILTPEQSAWALALSQATRQAECQTNAISEEQVWQLYLQGMALQGVQEWLTKRAPQLSMQSPWGGDVSHALDALDALGDPEAIATLSQQLAATPDPVLALSQMRIGKFHTTLVTTDSSENPEVAIPRAAISPGPEDGLEDATGGATEGAIAPPSQFYILVEVLEELEQIRVAAYLRHDQLVASGVFATLEQPPVEDGLSLCWLNTDWFTPDPDRLLLELQCLEPAAIYQSETLAETSTIPETSPLTPAAVTPAVTPAQLLLETTEKLSQRAINVSLWLRDQLDQVAQEFDWILLPPQAAFRAVRSPVEEYDTLRNNLADQGIRIPPQARAAHRELLWGNLELHLYVVIWHNDFASLDLESNLMIILSTPTDVAMPVGTRLLVRDEQVLLVEAEMRQASAEAYLYAQVGGIQGEMFWVEIELPGAARLRLPPFQLGY